MLYPILPYHKPSDVEFILESVPKNDDLDLVKIAEIEQRLLTGVTQEEAELFLDFMVYNARMALNCLSTTNILDCSFQNQCAPMANLNRVLLEKMNLPHHQFNVGHVVTKEKASMHEVIMIALPILENNGIVIKNFLLDPSFIQFFIKENCDISTYYGEKKGNIRKAAPAAGYFFNLSAYGKQLAKSLIKNGYMEMTLENIKYYFDAFQLSTMEKEAYVSQDLLGKCYQTDISANRYLELIQESKSYLLPPNDQYLSYLYTATEIVAKRNSGFINQIKNFFHHRDVSSVKAEDGSHHK